MSEINYSSENEDLMNPTDDLKNKIVTLASTIRDWNIETLKVRKSVRVLLSEIIDLGLNKRKMQKTELRNLVDEIFQYYGISESWIRKLLPQGLKDTSKTRISYLQKQEIEKERQRLLQQQAEESQHEPNIRPLKPETTQSSSERGEVGIPEYSSQDCETLSSSRSNELTKVQDEQSDAYKKIKKLEGEVRRLSEPFVARAILQTYTETVSLVVHIDPVNKIITRIGYENDSK